MYTYYVTQSDVGCESAATMVTLTIHELPTVTRASAQQFCDSVLAVVQRAVVEGAAK